MRLRDGLVPLVASAPEIDDALLRVGPFPEAGQRALLGTVLRAIGVDDEQWRLDEATHPFEATIAMTDVRLTTRYDEADIDSLYSSLHEFGHGLYEHQIDPALERTPLAGGASSAWHESQSRLWENMVGRSGGFWRWCLPHAQAALPERFAGVTWQEVQRAANAVRPSFIRVSADEVTYGLHIALRFELELALIEGDLAVADLPGGVERAHAALSRPRRARRRPRRAAGHPLGRGRVRLLPDLRGGQRHRRPGVGARDGRAARPRRAASRPATSRRCANGWPSTSTASAAATCPPRCSSASSARASTPRPTWPTSRPRSMHQRS